MTVRAVARRTVTVTAGAPRRSWPWRHRRALTPPAVVLAVWVAGCGGYELPWRAAVGAVVVMGIAAVWAFAALMADAVGVRGTLTVWAALLWLLAALVIPPWSRVALAVGAVLAVPFLSSWWWHLTRPAKTPVQVAHEVLTWDALLGADKRVLEGSWVGKAAALPHPTKPGKTTGFRLIVRLPPGKLTLDDVRKAVPRIASAYGVAKEAVTVEPVAGRDASAAMVTVMERSPLHAVQPWPGPSLDRERGTLRIGVHEDGAAAVWRLWRPGSGAVHGLIAGTTGSGKSGTSNVLLSEAAMSGLVATFLIDPKAGQSLPEWSHHLPSERVARTETEWTAMLAGVVRVMDARAAHLATVQWVDAEDRDRVGLAHFDPMDPAHGLPLVLLFVDEAFTVLQKGSEAVRLLELIGTKGRSVGISVVFATQVPSVKSLGDSGTLRAMVASGQILVLRTSDKVSSGMLPMPQLPIDPSEIPADHPGMGFLSTRPAAMRGLWVKDPWGVASKAPVVALDALSAAAYAGVSSPQDTVPAPRAQGTPPGGLKGAPLLIAQHVIDHGPTTRMDLIAALPAYTDRGVRDAVARMLRAGHLVEGPDERLTIPDAEVGPPPV